MSWTYDKEGKQYVWSGVETGIGPSPHKGAGNLQNVNIATDTGEVMVSYARSQQSMTDTAATGSLNFIDSTHVGMSLGNGRLKGMWITVTASTHTGELPNANYYVLPSIGGGFQLATTYNGSIITGFTSGLTATVSLLRRMGTPVAWTQETYFNSASAQYQRFYVLDSAGLVWVYDTINDALYDPTNDQVAWFLPDNSVSYFGSDTAPSGVGVLNGWLYSLSGNKLWVKPTVNLGSGYDQMTNALMMSRATSSNPHFMLVGHQGKGYYTDGNYVGSIFPDTSILSGAANVQSYAEYTTSTTTGTISTLIGGSTPSTGANVGVTGFSRIPAVFFAATGGTRPAALAAHTVYYIQFSTGNQNFEVYAALTGGSALDITSGKSGIQYYNTFYPVGTHAGAYGDTPTMVFTPQRLNLPIFEVGTCMAEIGNTVIVGTQSSILYPWNQIDATPSTIIALPEAGTASLLTVNQMAYVFAGRKGNIYITDGNVASLVIKVPDYCAGVAGTKTSYNEPVFTWGGNMYLRGRVYFSILDQTTTKAGNCGGVWSFYPTQNLYVGQDTGLALRQENISSYGTYSGVATVLIPHPNQGVKGPQYWSGWYTSVTSPTKGIDFSGLVASVAGVVETDFLPTGTFLDKESFSQVEYKLAAPLTSGDSVQLYFRVNATDAWTSCGAVVAETDQLLSGYFKAVFQKTQWVQLQAVLTPNSGSDSSLCRLSQLLLR